jgi:hypothetical protein
MLGFIQQGFLAHEELLPSTEGSIEPWLTSEGIEIIDGHAPRGNYSAIKL